MIQRRHILIAIAVFTLISVAYFLLVLYPRIGKVPIDIVVNPSDASISIDDRRVSSGTQYLNPGTYTFKAEREGWFPDEVSVTISDRLSSVALLPTPSSDEAREQAERDSTVREGLSSIAANARGLDIRSAYPILNELPYSDVSGPFKIDYGFNQDNTKTPYLIVSYSTPHGRNKAIDWLKANDTNLTTTEILFEDFQNPTYQPEDNHE